MAKGQIRVLMTKSRMDAHDRGAMTVTAALRDAGMEVVFTRFADFREIASAALQEGVDVIGVSLSTGNHLVVAEELRKNLKERGVEDILVIFGGIIPNHDVPDLHKLGVHGVFGPGSHLQDIVGFVKTGIEDKSEKNGLASNGEDIL